MVERHQLEIIGPSIWHAWQALACNPSYPASFFGDNQHRDEGCALPQSFHHGDTEGAETYGEKGIGPMPLHHIADVTFRSAIGKYSAVLLATSHIVMTIV